eukprot:2047521-Rhodomonas_salina.1
MLCDAWCCIVAIELCPGYAMPGTEWCLLSYDPGTRCLVLTQRAITTRQGLPVRPPTADMFHSRPPPATRRAALSCYAPAMGCPVLT